MWCVSCRGAITIKKREVSEKGRWPEGGDMGGAGLERDKWEIAGSGGVGLSQ